MVKRDLQSKNPLEERKKLLKLVKKKGVLVEVMPKGESILLRRPKTLYKKSLGSTYSYSLFRKKVKNVYVVYEDFDGTIKYYDYPQ